MPDMMSSAIVIVPNTKSSGQQRGEPFGGKRPEQPEGDGQGTDQDGGERGDDRGRLLADPARQPGAIATARTAETK